MPIYDYKCVNCGISIEKLESINSPTTQECKSCGQSDGLKRQIARSSFSLTGSGWYKDNYSKK